ncbi:MAG: hypothetical protein PHD32_02365 [Eubacteriales bacterium]|nr:hypothetical protein [Eubacteriales bacterium]
MRKNPRQMLGRLGVCLVGLALICVSASLLYLINWGSDPYQVFMVGLHRKLNISYGMANYAMNGLIFVLMLIFNRKYINVAMFFSVFLNGALIDGFTWIFQHFLSPESVWPIKAGVLVLGSVLLAFGVYLYLLPQLGASPADGVGMILSDVTHIPYKHVRLITDATYALLGFLLGGTVGVTTLVTALATGPLIGLFQRWLGTPRWLKAALPPQGEKSA